jgi:hypothetical protein
VFAAGIDRIGGNKLLQKCSHWTSYPACRSPTRSTSKACTADKEKKKLQCDRKPTLCPALKTHPSTEQPTNSLPSQAPPKKRELMPLSWIAHLRSHNGSYT